MLCAQQVMARLPVLSWGFELLQCITVVRKTRKPWPQEGPSFGEGLLLWMPGTSGVLPWASDLVSGDRSGTIISNDLIADAKGILRVRFTCLYPSQK
jgi:hypothetical protein